MEGYALTGRHGLLATYESFAMVMASMAIQHSKWLDESLKLEWRKPIPALNILLTSTCWRNDHNGFSHQGPGFIDSMLTRKPAGVAHLPAARRQLPALDRRTTASAPRTTSTSSSSTSSRSSSTWISSPAKGHCERGASVWEWASNDEGDPDMVMACAGDIPTMETLAATWLLRTAAPGLRIRVVNVVDLMAMFTPEEHPHGMDEKRSWISSPATGTWCSPSMVIRWGSTTPCTADPSGALPRSRVSEQGTTTTPFDMVVLNGISRYHLAMEALRRARRIPENSPELVERFQELLRKHRAYVEEHLEDMPEVRDWVWSPPS
jgi:xylulose-5-phosphate/fructose-6-phosphate phosphoketolase